MLHVEIVYQLFSLPLCGSATCEEGDVRLMVNREDTRAYVNDTQRQGWVELCLNKQYRSVCDRNWEHESASVVCGELGLSRYGECPAPHSVV